MGLRNRSQKHDSSPDEEKKQEEEKKEETPEKSKQEKLLDAARMLGINLPESTAPVEAHSGYFGLTPHGIEGGQMLAEMINKTWISARTQGAPMETLEHYGAVLLGGFAIALAGAMAGDAEMRNPLELIAAVMDMAADEQAEKAADICEKAAETLRSAAPGLQAAHEDRLQQESETPKLVDPSAAQELAELFRAEAVEEKGEEHGNSSENA